MIHGAGHTDPAPTSPFDQDAIRRHLERLPLRAVAAYAARWGLRMERFIGRLEPRHQVPAGRLARVAVALACGGQSGDRRQVNNTALRFQMIALRAYLRSAWHRARMLWALARGDQARFWASMRARDEAVAVCNIAGAIAGLVHAALGAEDLVASGDRGADFEQHLAWSRARLIAAALSAAGVVAYFDGDRTVAGASDADLSRLSALIPGAATWLGLPIDPGADGPLGPLWPQSPPSR